MPSQFPLTFLQTERATLLFIAQFFSILVLIGMVYLNWVLLLLFQNFMSGSRLELMCIFLIVNIWSSLCCSIAYGNHFFRVYHQTKSSASTDKFRQASNRCKWALEAGQTCLCWQNKKKSSILIVLSIKGKSVNLLCIMVLRCCLLHWIR